MPSKSYHEEPKHLKRIPVNAASHMQRVARQANLFSVDGFEQHPTVDRLYGQGVCYALSIAYLMHARRNVDFIQTFDLNGMSAELQALVLATQQWQQQRHDTNSPMRSIEETIVHFFTHEHARLPMHKMKYARHAFLDGESLRTYSHLADYLFRMEKNYHFILIPGHAMAAVTGPNASSVYFFDPNGGQVVSNRTEDLAKFFRNYFGVMKRNSKGKVQYNGDYPVMQKYLRTFASWYSNPQSYVYGDSMSVSICSFTKIAKKKAMNSKSKK